MFSGMRGGLLISPHKPTHTQYANTHQFMRRYSTPMCLQFLLGMPPTLYCDLKCSYALSFAIGGGPCRTTDPFKIPARRHSRAALSSAVLLMYGATHAITQSRSGCRSWLIDRSTTGRAVSQCHNDEYRVEPNQTLSHWR